MWQAQFPQDARHQVALRGTGEDDRRLRREGGHALHERQGRSTTPLAGPVLVGKHDHVGGRHRLDVVCALEGGVGGFDRAGLEDVERLACSDVALLVDQQHASDRVAGGEGRSERTAEVSRAKDGDRVHRYGIVYGGLPTAGSMMSSLDAKVAVVTGGSRGIGHATAAALLARGAAVAISGTNQARLDEACAGLSAGGAGDRVIGIRADVRQDREVAALIDGAVERFGGLDVLVNNAGIGEFVDVASMSSDVWHRVIGTNLTGVFYCCRAAIPHFRRRGGGWIINVSSLAAKNALAGGAAYCASKAGLNAFTESLMQEVRHDGIRGSCVMPGSVRTEFRTGGGAAGSEWKLAPEDVAQVIVDLVAHPLRSLPSRVELRPAQPPRK